MIINEQLRQYITGAIEDYYAEGYRPNLKQIILNTYTDFDHLTYEEVVKAVGLVAKEVISGK